MERLCKAAPWLGDIVAALITQQTTLPTKRWAGYRLRAIDATAICQPGADRTTWRLHVGYDLASGQVDQIALTDGRGAENLQRLTYRPGEIVLGDRIYAKARDLQLGRGTVPTSLCAPAGVHCVLSARMAANSTYLQHSTLRRGKRAR
jgi:hypothetical protein